MEQAHNQPPQGAGQGQPPQQGQGGDDGPSTLAYATCGVGVLGFCCLPAGIAALVMAYLEWNNIESGESSEDGKTFVMIGAGFAVAGMVLGCVGIILNFLVL